MNYDARTSPCADYRGCTPGHQGNLNQGAHQTVCCPYWAIAASCYCCSPEKQLRKQQIRISSSVKTFSCCLLACCLGAARAASPNRGVPLTRVKRFRHRKCGSNPLHSSQIRYPCLAETAPPSTCNPM